MKERHRRLLQQLAQYASEESTAWLEEGMGKSEKLGQRASLGSWLFSPPHPRGWGRRFLQLLRSDGHIERAALGIRTFGSWLWLFSGSWSGRERRQIQQAFSTASSEVSTWFSGHTLHISYPEGDALLLTEPPLVTPLKTFAEGWLSALLLRTYGHRLAREKAQLEQTVREQTTLLEALENTTSQGRFGLIGTSPAMRQVYSLIESFRNLEHTVLIEGESGTGKELVAKALHFTSCRKNRPFVSENCAAIPSSMLESLLFGHEKGAFSGAHCRQIGLFQQVGQGTLFLDEIGELPLPLQAKLLRALQERQFRPLGARHTQPFKARIVVATNKKLTQLVREGRFREDLFYRLHQLTIPLPPLRKRGEDILLLVRHFIEKGEQIFGRTLALARGVEQYLLQYPWPGNVRELENEVLRLFSLGRRKLSLANLSERIQVFFRKGGTLGTYREEQEEREREAVLAALERHNWNKARAARELGIHRSTLYAKIRKYQLVRCEG